MKSYFLLALLSSVALIKDSSFSSTFKTWSEQEGLKTASVSFEVYDLAAKRNLFQHNAYKTLAPASTQKIITTAHALNRYGRSYRYKSLIGVDPIMQNGIVKGNLYVKPNANPSLVSKRYNRSVSELTDSIIAFLKRHSIQKIEGKVMIIDPTYQKETLPRTWIYEDIGNYFGANPTGTIFNENILELTFNTGKVGMRPQLIGSYPKVPNLKIENRTISKGTSDQGYAFSIPESNRIVIEGTLPANRTNFTLKASNPKPHATLGYYVSKALQFDGIMDKMDYGISQFEPDMMKYIGTVQSVTLGDLVHQTNLKSVNILAENLKQLSEKGAKDLFKNYQFPGRKAFGGLNGALLKDGSGLSRFNAVAAHHLIQVLEFMHHHKDSIVFKNSLPIAGESGSLRSMFTNTPLKGKLIAKSGYMQGVRSYAGYFTTKTGKKAAFAVIINNYTCSASSAKRKLEDLLLEAYNQL